MADILVVTGASRGIGRHIACRAAEAGFEVIGLARTPSEAPFEIRACDVGDAEALQSALADLRREPRLWGLVNAAGMARMNLLATMEARSAETIVRTNLMGTIHCCRLLARSLIRRGEGRIVNFSSIAVPLALKGETVYAAAKAGIESFSRTLARELGEFAVTVNTIAPGPVDTDLIAKVPAESISRIMEGQLLPYKAEPEDIWQVTAFLLSRQARMVTGDVFHIGGA
ncbi:MAG: SDR family oxidoreductase [Alphaproteobacteria bacterium]|nr:SDR family oxidoreductase [Alphaproteobacteria bacterium]